jgi:anti-sigma factor RsiW
MDHTEIESLLGAYALDAVSPEEAAEIEEHLRTCPRCRAEVAALLGGGGAEAPAGIWDKISAELGEGEHVADLDAARLMRQIHPGRSRRLRRRTLIPIGLVAAAVVALFAIESTQLSHLTNEEHQYQAIASGVV